MRKNTENVRAGSGFIATSRSHWICAGQRRLSLASAISTTILASDIDTENKKRFAKWTVKMGSGLVFIEEQDRGTYIQVLVNNLLLSQCYNCDTIAVWVNQNPIFPSQKAGVSPNIDLPDDITRDFEEARSIFTLSPRGAAEC